MTHKPTELCHNVSIYFLNELADADKLDFEQHLPSCASCQEELRDIRSVWNQLPSAMEEVEPPPDLRDQVFSSIFPEQPVARPRIKGGQKLRWDSVWTKAAVLLLVAGLVWNNIALRDQLTQIDPPSPAHVVASYAMVSPDPALKNASGNAWIIQAGPKRSLIIQMAGLPSTQGEEAYQVWLIKDGIRQSAGTVQVKDNGTAVLTYTERGASGFQFDQIGITIEPDPYGTQPRGKKVLGTV